MTDNNQEQEQQSKGLYIVMLEFMHKESNTCMINFDIRSGTSKEKVIDEAMLSARIDLASGIFEEQEGWEVNEATAALRLTAETKQSIFEDLVRDPEVNKHDVLLRAYYKHQRNYYGAYEDDEPDDYLNGQEKPWLIEE